MTQTENLDYGPLKDLIGVWKGDKGMDISPEPDGSEENPYYETITFSPIGDVTNAESQTLVALHYRQIVQRHSNDEVFHDETGYWMWDADTGILMHSLTIPRAVGVLAGGYHDGERQRDGSFVLEVSASLDDENWQIIQSPFMRDHACTTAFQHVLTVNKDKLDYQEKTAVEIYGKVFEHTDNNTLFKQA